MILTLDFKLLDIKKRTKNYVFEKKQHELNRVLVCFKFLWKQFNLPRLNGENWLKKWKSFPSVKMKAVSFKFGGHILTVGVKGQLYCIVKTPEMVDFVCCLQFQTEMWFTAAVLKWWHLSDFT